MHRTAPATENGSNGPSGLQDDTCVKSIIRSTFRGSEFDKPGSECNSTILEKLHVQPSTARGAFGKIWVGKLQCHGASPDVPGPEVVVKLQHVYLREGAQRKAELRALAVIQTLLNRGIPGFIETFYVWAWESAHTTDAPPQSLCALGMVMERGTSDLMEYLNAHTKDTSGPSATQATDCFVVSCCLQVMAACSAIYDAADTVHGDLKCNNVVLLPAEMGKSSGLLMRVWGRRRHVRTGGYTAALIDFGAAQSATEAARHAIHSDEALHMRYTFTPHGQVHIPLHAYTFNNAKGKRCLHDSYTRHGVLPVWMDTIQWFSSLLTFVRETARCPWRIWCLRALAMCRWFEECAYTAIACTAGKLSAVDAESYIKSLRPSPIHVGEYAYGAPPLSNNMRWKIVQRDATSVASWLQDIHLGTLGQYNSTTVAQVIRRDYARFCNLAYSCDFLADSGIYTPGLFANVTMATTPLIDYHAPPSTPAQSDALRIPHIGRVCDQLDQLFANAN